MIQHEKDMLDEFISQSEAKGYVTSTKYYDGLIANQQKQNTQLKKQKAEQLAALKEGMESGTIKKNSEAWYEMVASVDETTKAIEAGNTAILEYQNNIRDINWQVFDMLQEKISNVAKETDFLIDLMSNDKLYEDNGQLTDAGMATMGLHAQNYDVYMAQSKKYAEEMQKIQAQLVNDPYDTELMNRKQELIDAQQEAISSAEQEKDAIKDMVEEGINLELDSLQDLIDKRNDALDSAKDQYEYQKKLAEQTKEVSDLEKQMAAYENDDSEEAKQKVQQLKVDLESAKTDLEETEYDQYISDQEKMMDELYTQYETILNSRLDNIDLLISDMTAVVDANAGAISDTITSKADDVGYKLSDTMTSIWNGESNLLNNTNSALNTINVNLQNMINQLNKLAGTNVKGAETSSAANSDEANAEYKPPPPPPPPPTPPAPPKKEIRIGGLINAGNSRIYATSYGEGGGSQYFRSDPVYKVLDEQRGYLLVRHRGLSSGYTGWFKKGDVSAYRTGKRKILDNEMAWTQENGGEMIIRPSDGAVLTPLAKNDSVLNAGASKNIWDMANSPADFIKDSLGTDKIDSATSRSGQSSYTQNLDKVVFNMPNVKNYDQFVSQMQKDKNFERLVLAMTIDKVAGGSSLAKGKAIR